MSATVNVLSPQTQALYAGWQGPDAEALQSRVSGLRQSITKWPAIPALKAIMAEISGETGRWAKVRPPLRPLEAAQHEELFASVAGAGWSLKAAA